MANVRIYTASYCGYCRAAKHLLERKRVPFEEIEVSDDQEKRAWLVRETGSRNVPQVFIDDRPVGGFTDLLALDERGELDRLLQAGAAPG